MSYDAAYTRVRGLLDGVGAIETITDGRIPFVDDDSPIAMIESAGTIDGVNPNTRKAQVITTWWRFLIRTAVPINDTSKDSIAETESKLREVMQGILDACKSERSIELSAFDAARERESWIVVGGVTYRVVLVTISIQDQSYY